MYTEDSARLIARVHLPPVCYYLIFISVLFGNKSFFSFLKRNKKNMDWKSVGNGESQRIFFFFLRVGMT